MAINDDVIRVSSRDEFDLGFGQNTHRTLQDEVIMALCRPDLYVQNVINSRRRRSKYFCNVSCAGVAVHPITSVRKQHLDLLSLPAGGHIGVGGGNIARHVAGALVDRAQDLAGGRVGVATRLEGAGVSIKLAGAGAGNGAIGQAAWKVYPDGLAQWPESGRDQGHTLLGIGLAGVICKIAWHQGDDLLGADENRLLAAARYVARYNLGQDVPYTIFHASLATQPVISPMNVVRYGRSGR